MGSVGFNLLGLVWAGVGAGRRVWGPRGCACSGGGLPLSSCTAAQPACPLPAGLHYTPSCTAPCHPPVPQENRVVRLIRRQLVKRSIDMMSEIAGREDKKVGASAV